MANGQAIITSEYNLIVTLESDGKILPPRVLGRTDCERNAAYDVQNYIEETNARIAVPCHLVLFGIEETQTIHLGGRIYTGVPVMTRYINGSHVIEKHALVRKLWRRGVHSVMSDNKRFPARGLDVGELNARFAQAQSPVLAGTLEALLKKAKLLSPTYKVEARQAAAFTAYYQSQIAPVLSAVEACDARDHYLFLRDSTRSWEPLRLHHVIFNPRTNLVIGERYKPDNNSTDVVSVKERPLSDSVATRRRAYNITLAY